MHKNLFEYHGFNDMALQNGSNEIMKSKSLKTWKCINKCWRIYVFSFNDLITLMSFWI